MKKEETAIATEMGKRISMKKRRVETAGMKMDGRRVRKYIKEGHRKSNDSAFSKIVD